MPEGMIAHFVQPNPFTSAASIVFDVDAEQDGTIVLFDQWGRTLRIYQGTFSKGRNQYRLDMANLPPQGLIFYEIQLTSGQAVGKMIRIQ